MKITYDMQKREKTLQERGLDFADAVHVFEGDVIEIEDKRVDYGEKRILCYGNLGTLHIVVGYVKRGKSHHVFSMRRCHEKEWKKIWF